MKNENSDLYNASINYERTKCSERIAFMEGALWLCDLIQREKLFNLPGGEKMFQLGYEAGQDGVIRKAKEFCGKIWPIGQGPIVHQNNDSGAEG